MLVVRKAKESQDFPSRLSFTSHPSDTGHRPPWAAREAVTANGGKIPAFGGRQGRRRELTDWDRPPPPPPAHVLEHVLYCRQVPSQLLWLQELLEILFSFLMEEGGVLRFYF